MPENNTYADNASLCSIPRPPAAVQESACSVHQNRKTVSERTNEISPDGEFVRQNNLFTTPFGNGGNELPVEADRYRLLWAPICPWAHRQIIVLKLLGLDSVISVGTANPVRTAEGWSFGDNSDGKDPVLGIKLLSEVYEKADPHYGGRATVPVVVDAQTGKAVNNDYFKLSNYFETAWRPFHKEDVPDLYPEALRGEIDTLNDWLFHNVNNGVYKAGFAESQAEYEKAFDALFSALDELEKRLAGNRYLFGNHITDSDIRLYVTLARFDAAYYFVFRTNRNRLVDFPNLWNYAKDLYQTPGFGDTTDFDAIKRGYWLSDQNRNPYQLLAKGPDLSAWSEAHDRKRFEGGIQRGV